MVLARKMICSGKYCPTDIIGSTAIMVQPSQVYVYPRAARHLRPPYLQNYMRRKTIGN
jgi:hypothetical protein